MHLTYLEGTMKLMSLFDGSGGFPLAASLCGIDPVYASEVEPYPIAVTKSRFPNMKHLGDVSMVNGADIVPVDIITFGSPCQDMSVAGKRAGLKHTAVGDEETTRSGLFLEAIRIMKEMRLATNGIYPRFAVWENVPGAFSSNKGEDFRTVLEEFIRISEADAVMPAVPKAGWAYADCINGDGWSVAYRTFDAQYWGVPQRRRRIYLVADFRGGRAGEILFKREGLRGHTAQSGTQGEEATENVGNGIKADDRKRNCLTAYSFDSLSSNSMKSKNPFSGCRVVEVSKTLDTSTPDPSKNQGGIAIVQCIVLDDQGCEGGGKGPLVQTDKSATLATNNDQYLFQPVYCLQGNGIDRADTAGCNGKGWREDIVVESHPRYIVRRLTPTECARLQGFPDKWGHPDKKEDFTEEEYKFWLEVRNTYAKINGKSEKEYTKAQMLTWYSKLHTDSAEYKMWGNGIALPNALYVMQGIAAEAEIPINLS